MTKNWSFNGWLMALTWVLKGWLVDGINLGTQGSPLKPNKRGITSFVFHGKKERAPLLCCIFAHPRSGDLSARTSPEEQASEAVPSPSLHPRSRGAIKFLGNALAWLLATNGYIVYFLASSLHCELLHGINFDELHRTGSTSNVG